MPRRFARVARKHIIDATASRSQNGHKSFCTSTTEFDVRGQQQAVIADRTLCRRKKPATTIFRRANSVP
jgi:hypothetical protein